MTDHVLDREASSSQHGCLLFHCLVDGPLDCLNIRSTEFQYGRAAHTEHPFKDSPSANKGAACYLSMSITPEHRRVRTLNEKSRHSIVVFPSRCIVASLPGLTTGSPRVIEYLRVLESRFAATFSRSFEFGENLFSNLRTHREAGCKVEQSRSLAFSRIKMWIDSHRSSRSSANQTTFTCAVTVDATELWEWRFLWVFFRSRIVVSRLATRRSSTRQREATL